MPLIEPISEMQRSGAALAERANQTKEPIYLTKHGKASLVLIDAEEFDRRMDYREAIISREMERLAGISLGRSQILEGQGIPLTSALEELDARWDM